jgi:Ca2+-binding RTX toxin-like protein
MGDATNDTLDGGSGDNDIDTSQGDSNCVQVSMSYSAVEPVSQADTVLFAFPDPSTARVMTGALPTATAPINLDGGPGDDTILGSLGRDYLSGDDGNDVLNGRDGNDGLLGGSGDDSLDGGNDSDHLSGGDGRDTLQGGSGVDVLSSGPGRDLLFAFPAGAAYGSVAPDFFLEEPPNGDSDIIDVGPIPEHFAEDNTFHPDH